MKPQLTDVLDMIVHLRTEEDDQNAAQRQVDWLKRQVAAGYFTFKDLETTPEKLDSLPRQAEIKRLRGLMHFLNHTQPNYPKEKAVRQEIQAALDCGRVIWEELIT